MNPTNSITTILVPSGTPSLNEQLQIPESSLQPVSMTHTETTPQCSESLPYTIAVTVNSYFLVKASLTFRATAILAEIFLTHQEVSKAL